MFLFTVATSLLFFNPRFVVEPKSDERWQLFQRPCFLLALAMVGALLLYGILALVGWIGIGQRIYLAVCLLWMLVLAGWVWSVSVRENRTERKNMLPEQG